MVATKPTGLVWSLPASRGARPDMSSTSTPATSTSAMASTTRTRTSATAQPENRQQEGGEENLDSDDQHRCGNHGEAFIGERPEPMADPADEDHSPQRHAHEHEHT